MASKHDNQYAWEALQPLRPDKPEPAIAKGDVWIKKASGKTSVSAPRIRIMQDGYEVRVRPVNFSNKHGFVNTNERGITKNILWRDWRPCSATWDKEND